VVHLCNHCCCETTTIKVLFIVVCVDVAVSYIKVFSVAMEMQQWAPFTLMLSHKNFIPLLTLISIKYVEFMPVLLLLSRMRIAYVLHCVVLSSVACLAVSHFTTLSHKRYGLKINIENKMCFDFLCKFCLKDFSF
jgi:hypothetical protein